MKVQRGILLGTLVLLGSLILAGMRELRPEYVSYAGNSVPVGFIPSLTNEPEYCLTCHEGIEEISSAHPVEVFGCVSCHGGEPLSLDPDKAHAGLIGGRNPSDFNVVEERCGGEACHSGYPEDHRDHIARSLTSIQSTYAGAIAQVRFAFGAQEDQSARYGIQATPTLMFFSHGKKIRFKSRSKGRIDRFIVLRRSHELMGPIDYLLSNH